MTTESLKTIQAIKAERSRAMQKHPMMMQAMNIIACEERVEEAVFFLVKALAPRAKSGKKAVILHSLRVGFYLMSLGYDEKVVIAGVLHDVAEKTAIAPLELGRRFGFKVGRIVAAVTNNAEISDALERYRDSVQRCALYGPEALVVRAADLLDNFDRIYAKGNQERLARVVVKLRMLLKVGRKAQLDPRLLDELVQRMSWYSHRSRSRSDQKFP